jgi:hypothetical protein
MYMMFLGFVFREWVREFRTIVRENWGGREKVANDIMMAAFWLAVVLLGAWFVIILPWPVFVAVVVIMAALVATLNWSLRKY